MALKQYQVIKIGGDEGGFYVYDMYVNPPAEQGGPFPSQQEAQQLADQLNLQGASGGVQEQAPVEPPPAPVTG